MDNGVNMITNDLYKRVNEQFHSLKTRVQKGPQTKFNVMAEAKVATELSQAVVAFMAELQGILRAVNGTGKGAAKIKTSLLKLTKLWAMYNNALDQWIRYSVSRDKIVDTSPKEMVNSLIHVIPTLIGDVAEQQLVEAFNSKEFEQMIGRSAESQVGDILADNVKKGYVRGNISYTINTIQNQGQKNVKDTITFEKEAGTPIVDMKLSISQKGKSMPEGTFTATIKQKVGQSSYQGKGSKIEISEIKVLSTRFGALMQPDRIGASSNPYYWFTFMRVLGRLSANTNEVKDIKNFLAMTYGQEAIFGVGQDSVSDVIINGRIYSARYFASKINALIRGGKISSVIKLSTSKLQDDPLPSQKGISQADLAVQRYIHAKHINAMLGTKAEFEVKLLSSLT